MDDQYASAVNTHRIYWQEIHARIETLRQYSRLYTLTLHEMKVERMAATKDINVIRDLANCLFDNCLHYITIYRATMPRSEINDMLAIMVQLNLLLTIVE